MLSSHREDCDDAVQDRPTTPAATAASRRTREAFKPKSIIRGLAWDIGLPLVVFYGLHLAGVGDWDGLLGATLAVAARMGWVAVRNRALNLFSIVMLGAFGLGLALAFVNGEPRFLLLKSSIMTAVVGTMFLVSATPGRQPLTLAAEQHWAPNRATEIAEEYRTDPDVRHGHRVSSIVWGLGLLTEAIVRVPLVFLLPISVVVGLSTALTLAILAGLIVWTVLYPRAAAQRVEGRSC
jgi:hypothetical protein